MVRYGMEANRKRGVRYGLAAAVTLFVCGVSITASAVEFRSFTEVDNVCPDNCEPVPFDTITLQNGDEVRAHIVAKNPDFFVLERFGEVRALPQSRVQSTSWAEEGPPSNLSNQDQIVLDNGHVLTGSVVDESDEPGHLQLDSSIVANSYVVFKQEAASVYRGGDKETIETSSEGGASSESNAQPSSSSSESKSESESESSTPSESDDTSSDDDELPSSDELPSADEL